MSEGYSGLPNYYVQSSDPITPNLLLSLKGMDPIVAEDFVKIDTFAAGPFGSTLDVNGAPVSSPNLNNTTPAAPGGDLNVIFQVSGGNVSAYVPVSGIGTVTSFSSGNIGSIITTLVSNPSSTPALSFAIATQTANTVWAGPTTGVAAIPAFRALVVADLPTVNVNVGSFTYASITVNAEGLITAAASGVAPTGTVTSFSAGALSPLFTTSVATATTTPALTFSLSTQTANAVFAGPTSGGALAPTFRALVAADIPALPYGTGTVTSVSFTGGLISVATSTTTPALTVAGTSGGIPYFSSASTWATSAALPAGDFVLGGGAGAAPTASFSIVPIANGGTGAATTSQNFVFAGPASGGAGAPSFRALVTADIPAADFAWSALTNATAALTLNNSTFSTTFNQAAGDIWTWGLPSYTAAVSNSPTLELAGSYQSAAATFAKDFWTVINTPQAATTNGYNKLIFTHSGTTGNAYVAVPNIQFPGSSGGIDFLTNGWILLFSQQQNTGSAFQLAGGASVGGKLQTSAQGQPFQFSANYTTQTTGSAVSFGNNSSFTGTSGTVIGVEIGGNSGANGVTTGLTYTVAPASGSLKFIGAQIDPTFTPTTSSGGLQGLNVSPTFNPAAGSSTFVGVNIAPTVQGTSSGATTGLLVNPTLTVTNLSGLNLIADFQSGGVTKASIDYGGFYYSLGTKGVTQTAIAVGTLATTGGIVTTFTGVSDERLKDHAPYDGGLEEILGITPIRFTYNDLGQKFGGWDKDHVYVGFSAQNVQKSIPEAIQGTEGPEKYLSFDDRPVIAALVNAVKVLTARIKALEAK